MAKSSPGYTIATIAVALPLLAWKGYVLVVMWDWFVVPLGIPAIGMWHATGLAALITWLTETAVLTELVKRTDDPMDGKAAAKFWMGVVMGVVMPLVFLFSGAVSHALMSL